MYFNAGITFYSRTIFILVKGFCEFFIKSRPDFPGREKHIWTNYFFFLESATTAMPAARTTGAIASAIPVDF